MEYIRRMNKNLQDSPCKSNITETDAVQYSSKDAENLQGFFITEIAAVYVLLSIPLSDLNSKARTESTHLQMEPFSCSRWLAFCPKLSSAISVLQNAPETVVHDKYHWGKTQRISVSGFIGFHLSRQ